MQDESDEVSAGKSDAISSPPDQVACHEELRRILSRESFQVSPRHRKFLEFVVNESLAGRADRIKAYSIAVEVFGRDGNFDAQNDPIVRVEAGHLRRALERYYLDSGRTDPVRIAIPKGGYAPKFDWVTSPAAVMAEPMPAEVPIRSRPPGRTLAIGAGLLVLIVALAMILPMTGGQGGLGQPDVPRLVVQPFEDLSHPAGTSPVSEGLTQEVIGQISKFRDIVVLSGDREGEPLAPVTAVSAPRYTLAGTVEIDDQTLRLQVRILSRSDGSVIWANSYSGDLTVARLLQIERDIADEVATALAQPYGVIFQADTTRQVVSAPEDWAAYACTLSYYAYRAALDPTTHPVVRRCLEQAVARFPSYATAWALLSQVYVDELRFRFAADPAAGPASVERAMAAARRAIELDPRNIRALQAQMFALFFAGDVRAAVQVGQRALEINPNDTELMGEVGFRVALSGDWDTGCPLMDEAWQRNPGPLGYYENGLAICSYMAGDLDDARMWIRRNPLTGNPQYHLISAIIYGEAGDPAAAAEVEWMQQHAPHLCDHTRREIELRVARAEDVERILASLRKGGMPNAF